VTGLDLRGARLQGFGLNDTNLTDADFRGAVLDGAYLARAWLACADLRGASLVGANLAFADLTGADLRGADLRRANLSCAVLNGTELAGADLTGAIFDHTLVACDLTGVRGLTEIEHRGVSTVATIVLEKTRELPIAFLEGCRAGLGMWRALWERLRAA